MFCVKDLSKKTAVQYPYKLDDMPLALVSKVTYLGIQVTSNLDWSDHTCKICKKANKIRIVPVCYWLELLDLLFLFKAVHGISLPSGARPAIYVARKRTRRTTDNGMKLVVKKCRTTTYQNSYFIRATKLWNILPNDLTLENQSFCYFKKGLYSYCNKALKDIYDIDDNRTWTSV